MINNRDFIIVGQQPWDIEIGSNCKNIAHVLSENNRVLYVNPPLDRITLIRDRKDEKVKKRLKVIRGKTSGLEKTKDNLWNLYPDRMIESINWIKNDKLYNYLNKINNRRLASSISRTIERLNLKSYILFNDGDMFRSFYSKELLKPQMSIYYSRDYLLATDYYKFHGAKLEPLLIAKSDLCVANSTYLAGYCRKYNPKSYYVGQGCEPLFSQTIPCDLTNISGPIVGYVGALLSARLDLEILLLIASKNPLWQIVLVGPEDEQFKTSELHHMPNVHFMGPKAPEELGDYIQSFDVCINPQILNDLTVGNYPRKVDEYLSLGKPVVATNTEAMEVFKDFVYLADLKEQYPQLISMALEQNNPDQELKRKAFAATHTWENSVDEIYKAIESTVNI